MILEIRWTRCSLKRYGEPSFVADMITPPACGRWSAGEPGCEARVDRPERGCSQEAEVEGSASSKFGLGMAKITNVDIREMVNPLNSIVLNRP